MSKRVTVRTAERQCSACLPRRRTAGRLTRPFGTAGFQEPGLQDPEVQKSYYFVDTGLIAGNVYLFAASQGLASWFHNCDKAGLTRKLGLRADQRVLFAQTVGYPERK